MRNSLNMKVASVSAVGAVTLALIVGAAGNVYARNGDREEVMNREDVRDLRRRLGMLAARPDTYPPMIAFSEADDPSMLVQFFLTDTEGFSPTSLPQPFYSRANSLKNTGRNSIAFTTQLRKR